MKTATHNKLLTALATLDSLEDFHEVNLMFNSAQRDLSERVKRNFRVGDKVQFTASRTNKLIKCTIIAINIKNIKVREDDKEFGGLWNVAPAFLKARV